jgi:dTDP-4-dehydrorhamnose reductase
MKMRILVFGAKGMLGKALMRRWPTDGDDVTGIGSAQADIRIPEQVEKAFEQTTPDWTVLAAAYTDVDGCELNPQLASAVNTQGAVYVAEAAANAGSKLLFVSTDYVFDGQKKSPYEVDDPRNPINVYGRSKAEAEESILRALPGCCIVRTSWLFGPGLKCFPDTILKLAATRPEIEVVNDQRGCPTYTVDLADAIIKLCRNDAKGIVHCTNSGDCSWYDFASEIIRQSGLKTTIHPTASDRFVRPAQRPKYSVLSSVSLGKYGIEMRPWQETLADYLSQRD